MTISRVFREALLEDPPEGFAVAAAINGEDERDLGIAVEPQRGDRWCWASVAVGLRAFRRPDLPRMEQCELAERVLPGDLHCCGTPRAPEQCDKSAFLEDALTAAEVGAFPPDPTFSFSGISDEIRSDKPVACRIDFPPPKLPHFVVVDGFNVDRRQLSISDPQRGALTMDVTSFIADYNGEGGEWGATFRLT
jgi:hypothetical protein